VSLLVPSVSRKHCIFEVAQDGRLFVSDLGATIPTQLRNASLVVGQAHEVFSGDSLVLGDAISLTAWAEEDNDPAECKTQVVMEDDSQRTMMMPADEFSGTDVPPSANLDPVDDDLKSNNTAVLNFQDGTDVVDLEKESGSGVQKNASAAGMNTKTVYFDDNDIDLVEDTSPPCSETVVISDEELDEITRKSSSGRTKQILTAILVLSCGLLFIPEKKEQSARASAAETHHDGSYFSCGLPVGWIVSAKGGAVVLSERGTLRSGAALLRYESPEVRYWTYETHGDQLMSRLRDEIEFSVNTNKGHLFSSREEEQPASILRQHSFQQIPFVSPDIDDSKIIEARLYINNDVAICVVAWDETLQNRKELKSILESISLKEKDAYIDRRLWGSTVSRGEIPVKIETAGEWLGKAQIAPGNVWRGYVQLLEVRGWFARNGCPVDMLEYEKASYEMLKKIAAKLNETFLNKQRLALRALHNGQRSLYLQSLDSLQSEFPCRIDLRWIWAEKAKSNLINVKKNKRF
jgi:hypothetical protein